MKQNLLHVFVGFALAMATTAVFAQDVTETVSVKSDVTLDSGSPDKVNSTATSIEMYTWLNDDGSLKRDFIGLMSFLLPVKSGYSVKSATLRLVTERAKGSMAIYAFGADVSDADTYNSQKENVVNAKDNSLVFKKEDLLPHLTIIYEKKFHELAVTEAEAATLVLPYDAKIPEEVKAYTLSYTGGGKATATEVKDVLPANTPVLINAPKGNYQFTYTGNGSKADSPVKDGLVGVWEETTVPAGAFVLQNRNGKVAFYKVGEDSAIKIKANQAYLQLSATADSKLQSITIDFSDTTGIEVIDSVKSEQDEAIYTLSGMRVDKNQLKKNEIYICKGKAFGVK